MSDPNTPADPPPFSLRELPDWLKSLHLGPEVDEAVDRYLRPAWEPVKDKLPMLPTYGGRERVGALGAEHGWEESIRFDAVDEPSPGAAWQARFHAMWPGYRAWYLRDGLDARADLRTCRERLARYMPELVETYERLVELAGDDEVAARCLSLYRPPGFVVGCSQATWTRVRPMLVRNYDYPASRLEGVISKTGWTGRQIIGMSDCLWGLLDGINDAGLAVSLTFGGRRAVGDGFAIPLVVRYLLETCDTADQARHTLERIPVHAAQNVSVVDASGGTLTAHLAPDRGAEFTPTPVTTNHQGIVDWPEYTRAVHSVERERYLLGLLEDGAITPDRFVQAFLEPPLHNRNYSQGMGTLYTAVYHPTEGRVEYRWPGHTWAQSFDDFTCAAHTQTFADEPLAA